MLALEGFDADLHLIFQLSNEIELFRETIAFRTIAWSKEKPLKLKLPIYQTKPPVPLIQNVMSLGSNVEINYNAINGHIFIWCVSWRGGAPKIDLGNQSPRTICILNHKYLGESCNGKWVLDDLHPDPIQEMKDALLLSPESYPLRVAPAPPAASPRGNGEIEYPESASITIYSFPSCAILADYEIPYGRFYSEKLVQDDPRLGVTEPFGYRLKTKDLEIEFLFSEEGILLLLIIEYGDRRG